jgi:hypothetical protein
MPIIMTNNGRRVMCEIFWRAVYHARSSFEKEEHPVNVIHEVVYRYNCICREMTVYGQATMADYYHIYSACSLILVG